MPEAASAAIAAVGSANAEVPIPTTTADGAADGEDVPRELKDLRQRLNYLKNIYDIKDSVGFRTSNNAKQIYLSYLKGYGRQSSRINVYSNMAGAISQSRMLY